MTTATKHIKAIAQAPTARGSFSAEILYNDERGDHDNERIENWRNIPCAVDLMYSHSYNDPSGAVIGVANARPKGDGKRLQISANLDLTRPMARATHERLLLPRDDPQSMGELSVGFSYDPMRVWVDGRGVKVLPDATLLEISVVARGSQETTIFDVKAAAKHGARNSAADLERIQRMHDNALELGATCYPSTLTQPSVPKNRASKCSCGATVSGPWKTTTATKAGQSLGVLSFRACPRCKMLELDGNAAIRRAGDGDFWARYVKNRTRIDPEVAKVKAFFDNAERGIRKVGRNKAVDIAGFMAEDRELRRKERAAEAELLETVAGLSLLPGQLIPGLEEDQERDRESFERTAAAIAQRDQERAREAEERERADEARRGGDVQIFEGQG
jgi:ADP-ribose pyrophosphatase YjhB (NUDIX family)